jgi:Tetratricopeptide repeat
MNFRPPCLMEHLIRVLRLESRARLPFLFLLISLLVGPAAFNGAAQSTTLKRAIHAKPSATAENTIDGYAGSQACAFCHSDIYSKYVQTEMGRSMSNITPALLRQLHLPATFYDQRMNRHYDVYARDGKLYQSEYETDAGGKEIFRATHQVRWTVGSGAVTGGVVQRGDYLFEAPLTLYTKPMKWAPAPGYEFADYSFSRPILAGCIFCHSGRANPVPATNGRYSAVAFSELAVGCENCHGPGAAHVEGMKSGRNLSQTNFSIVNPSRLSPELANNICMACHEIGDERILQPGKRYQDVRPGTPLDNTLSILRVPPTRKSPAQPDHLEHYYSMTLSKCYRASEGRLRCITCHDPHLQLSRQEAPAFYNERCLTCHTDQSCSLSRVTRQSHNPADNCIGCHMQKREVTFIAHTSLTNHRIVAQPDEPFPDEMLQQTTTALPDLIHLNPAPGQKDVPPSPLTLLQAYAELAADDPEYVSPYFAVLEHLSRTEPNNALVQTALGSKDMKDGKIPEAVDHLQRALQIGPPQASVYALLSMALASLGRSGEALAAQQKAIEQDPYNPNLQKTLVSLLIDRKQYADAQAAMKRYLEVFPQDSFMRNMLATSRGKAPQKDLRIQ